MAFGGGAYGRLLFHEVEPSGIGLVLIKQAPDSSLDLSSCKDIGELSSPQPGPTIWIWDFQPPAIGAIGSAVDKPPRLWYPSTVA